MSEERLKREGRLLEYRQEAAKLRLALDGLRRSLRNLLDPDQALRDIRGDLVGHQGLEFWAVQQRYRETLEEIERIEKDLGIRSNR